MVFYSDTVTFPGATIPQLTGALAHPDGEGPFPGVIVIHEAYGLNDNIRQITRRFAEQGYAALGVDLFTGHGNRAVCMARLMSGMLFNSLDHGAIKDLKAALDYLATQAFVARNRLGAVGYCMGGSLAIAWACTDSRLKAIAPYYGMNPRPLEAVARGCPVVGSYPEQDFTAAAGRALDAELDKLKIDHDIKIYPGAKHSFFNDQRGSYDPAAAQDSWTRVVAFFEQHIKA